MRQAELIKHMEDPDSYTEKPRSITLIQTHISWVFIGDEYVYKIKKPVNFGFLDFSSLEKRRFYVGEELRLNKRFSPDIYLDALPISEEKGSFVIGDSSNIIEYALKMKRINEEDMLYKLLEANKVTPELMQRLGRHIADVYRKIPSDEKTKAYGSLDTISRNVMENFEQTLKYIGGPVSQEAYNKIRVWSMAFMEDNKSLFEKRMDGGYIKDCHGDLHLQHICIDDERIVIFDCIEFNERFRFGDVASDIAFLAMDLDYNGYKNLRETFVNTYIDASGDTMLKDVLKFYKIYRAYVRAKVTSFMLDDTGLDTVTKDKAYQKAKSYYTLALEYTKFE
ncbi:MAG: hypothetical protein J7L53_02045 [Deltaproteobacteria bacterium]|nr:hypothetical protein [Deltaproteobacteria bacterium]